MRRATRDLCEACVVLADLFVMSAVQIELVLVLHAFAEDQIAARLFIAIHVVLIELWAP